MKNTSDTTEAANGYDTERLDDTLRRMEQLTAQLAERRRLLSIKVGESKRISAQMEAIAHEMESMEKELEDCRLLMEDGTRQSVSVSQMVDYVEGIPSDQRDRIGFNKEMIRDCCDRDGMLSSENNRRLRDAGLAPSRPFVQQTALVEVKNNKTAIINTRQS